MSTDLDTRLRSLSELSPPSHAPLGASELHRRATKRQQRAIAARAVPAVIVVVALLAGAVALAGRSTTTDVVVGPPGRGSDATWPTPGPADPRLPGRPPTSATSSTARWC